MINRSRTIIITVLSDETHSPRYAVSDAVPYNGGRFRCRWRVRPRPPYCSPDDCLLRSYGDWDSSKWPSHLYLPQRVRCDIIGINRNASPLRHGRLHNRARDLDPDWAWNIQLLVHDSHRDYRHREHYTSRRQPDRHPWNGIS